MGSPQVPIDVDPETGIWRTDGLPMIYLPRHFLVNNHLAVARALGREAYREILRTATEQSAIHWCRTESQTHHLDPEATFRHYFKRLSQRGWGRFSVELLDPEAKRVEIGLENSVFVLESTEWAGRPACYMFEGFVSGAFRFLLEALGRELSATRVHSCEEILCAADGRQQHCRFEFR